MIKYNKATIENVVSEFETCLIKEITAIKIYDISYIENSFGNECYYRPEYTSWEYVFTLSEAKEICRENRKRGRNFRIDEEIFLGIRIDNGNLFLLNDFRGMCYMSHIIKRFHNSSDIDFYNIIMYLFMIASMKNNTMICLHTKYQVEDIEYVNSGVGLNRYRSNFEFGILGWDRYKITYDGECPAVAATLNILLGI